jgi:hypothetical protein
MQDETPLNHLSVKIDWQRADDIRPYGLSRN